ncbi:MAG: hypothetical protein HY699_23775 [Deltaproteobacteria bacterium]|nr:hypothetical protein [Deltaproteobacteria bacterium]
MTTQTLQEAESAPGHVFRRDGEYWTIEYQGAVLHLRDCKGLQYLALLLQRPGERVAAGELADRGEQSAKPDVERARVAVSKRIKAVIEKIRWYDAALGDYLGATIKTGYHCAYLPAPAGPSLHAWVVSPTNWSSRRSDRDASKE